jgi:hypothetical protein
MSPLHWLTRKAPAPWLAAALMMSFPASQALASIHRPDALAVSSAPAAKRCSGAFRYAAREGNDEIVPLSPVQMFAKDRRLARTHYALAPAGFETAAARLRSVTAMCGAG